MSFIALRLLRLIQVTKTTQYPLINPTDVWVTDVFYCSDIVVSISTLFVMINP